MCKHNVLAQRGPMNVLEGDLKTCISRSTLFIGKIQRKDILECLRNRGGRGAKPQKGNREEWK